MRKLLIFMSVIFICTSSMAEDLKWTVPSTWEDLKQASSMRLATLAPKENKDLLVKVSRFPGNVGGELANVNRWRGQLGLKGIKPNELTKALEVFETKVGKAKLLDIKNNGKQMLAAMVPFNKQTYFFKVMGAEAEVSKEKAALVELIKSFK